MLKMKITKPKIVLGLFAIFVIVIIYRQCSPSTADVYEYGKLMRGNISKSIAATGTLELYNPVNISSGVEGVLKNIYVDFNSRVHKGQSLGYVESIESDRNYLQQAENMKKAKVELEGQVEFLEAKRNMLAEGLISQKDFELSQKTYNLANSNYQFQKKIFDQLLEEQRRKNIISPSDGVVIHIFAENNTLLKIGAPLFLIAPTLKKMKLIINIDENDVGVVNKGQPVEFTVSAYPEKKFSGIIDQVRMNPKTISGMVTYESLVICENPEEILRPGMTVSAIIRVATKTNVLIIPNQALVVTPGKVKLDPEKKYLWLKRSLGAKKLPVKKVEVKTGLQGDTHTEIISGQVKEGDQVLTGYYQKQID